MLRRVYADLIGQANPSGRVDRDQDDVASRAARVTNASIWVRHAVCDAAHATAIPNTRGVTVMDWSAVAAHTHALRRATPGGRLCQPSATQARATFDAAIRQAAVVLATIQALPGGMQHAPCDLAQAAVYHLAVALHEWSTVSHVSACYDVAALAAAVEPVLDADMAWLVTNAHAAVVSELRAVTTIDLHASTTPADAARVALAAARRGDTTVSGTRGEEMLCWYMQHVAPVDGTARRAALTAALEAGAGNIHALQQNVQREEEAARTSQALSTVERLAGTAAALQALNTSITDAWPLLASSSAEEALALFRTPAVGRANWAAVLDLFKQLNDVLGDRIKAGTACADRTIVTGTDSAGALTTDTQNVCGSGKPLTRVLATSTMSAMQAARDALNVTVTALRAELVTQAMGAAAAAVAPVQWEYAYTETARAVAAFTAADTDDAVASRNRAAVAASAAPGSSMWSRLVALGASGRAAIAGALAAAATVAGQDGNSAVTATVAPLTATAGLVQAFDASASEDTMTALARGSAWQVLSAAADGASAAAGAATAKGCDLLADTTGTCGALAQLAVVWDQLGVTPETKDALAVNAAADAVADVVPMAVAVRSVAREFTVAPVDAPTSVAHAACAAWEALASQLAGHRDTSIVPGTVATAAVTTASDAWHSINTAIAAASAAASATAVDYTCGGGRHARCGALSCCHR